MVSDPPSNCEGMGAERGGGLEKFYCKGGLNLYEGEGSNLLGRIESPLEFMCTEKTQLNNKSITTLYYHLNSGLKTKIVCNRPGQRVFYTRDIR